MIHENLHVYQMHKQNSKLQQFINGIRYSGKSLTGRASKMRAFHLSKQAATPPPPQTGKQTHSFLKITSIIQFIIFFVFIQLDFEKTLALMNLICSTTMRNSRRFLSFSSLKKPKKIKIGRTHPITTAHYQKNFFLSSFQGIS